MFLKYSKFTTIPREMVYKYKDLKILKYIIEKKYVFKMYMLPFNEDIFFLYKIHANNYIIVYTKHFYNM